MLCVTKGPPTPGFYHEGCLRIAKDANTIADLKKKIDDLSSKLMD